MEWTLDNKQDVEKQRLRFTLDWRIIEKIPKTQAQ